MDQEIVKAFVASAKLVWEHDLKKELLSRPDSKEVMASMPVAVTAIFNVSGDVTGHVVCVMTKQTAIGVVSVVRGRWSEEIDERTLDAVAEIAGSVADHATTLLERAGYKCEVEVFKVVDSGGKGIANPSKWAYATQIASTPDFKNLGDMDEVGIWFDLKVAEGVEPKPEKAPSISKKSASEPEEESTAEPQELHDESPAPEDDDRPGSLPTRIESELGEEDAAPAPEPEEGSGRSRLLELEDEEEAESLETLQEAAGADGAEAGPARFQELSAGVFQAKRVEIPDPSGTVRATVGTSPDGSPFVALSGSDGRARLTFALSANGSPRLVFEDDLGGTVYDVPSSTSEQPPTSRRPVKRPAQQPARAVPRKDDLPPAADAATGPAPLRQRPAR